MNRKIRELIEDESGSNVIEFAIAVPILTLMIYGIFTVGMLFQANAGVQHALGEAARYATIYPTPADADITAMVADKKFGTDRGTLGTLQIANETNAAGKVTAKTLTLTYTQPTDFLFFPGPNVNITQSKKVYLAI